MTPHTDDWQALSADWQGQDTPRIDLDALRREAARRGRALRWTVAVETLATALVVAVSVYIGSLPVVTGVERAIFLGLAVFMLAYQGAMVWLRRRQWSERGCDAASLVDLERRRAQTVLRYWRWGIWTSLALWMLLYAVFMAGLAGGARSSQLAGMAGGLGVNVFIFPLMGAYGVWRCRQARARIARLDALRAQLQAP